MSRPNTPAEDLPTGGRRMTVKRTCDRCDRELGDATREELDAAMDGLPLPSVVDECGCLIAATAVLIVQDHRRARRIAGPYDAWFECICGQWLEGPTQLPAHQVEVVHFAIRQLRTPEKETPA